MKKGILSFLAAVILFTSLPLPALAQGVNILSQPVDNTAIDPLAYEFGEQSSFMPEARYVGIAETNLSIRREMDTEAEAVGHYSKGDRVYIVDYEPNWLYVVKGDDSNWVSGYVLRHWVWDVSTYKLGELPYGTTPGTYSAIISRDTKLYDEANASSPSSFTLTAGTKVAILEIQDGWAKVIYWRKYGYFYVGDAQSLTPVYDLSTAQSGDTIAAFNSFYRIDDNGLNTNRKHNIALACDYISILLVPGQEFAFNSIAGPYLKTRGYLEAPSYVDGETVPSNGGGTCQVSSTLYNTILALNGNITVLYRRAHGPSGATYLPHGVDAACGNSSLDLVFRNDCDYSVMIEASAKDGVLYIAVVKA